MKLKNKIRLKSILDSNRCLIFKPSSEFGFTLIELLVVIAVVGLLSSVILASVGQVRVKAQNAKVREDLQQLVKQVSFSRDTQGMLVKDITGTLWSAGSCTNWGSPYSIKNIADTSSCYTGLQANFKKFGFPSVPRDPWGSPYLIIEGEGIDFGNIGNSCQHHDRVFSAGPNGIAEDANPSSDDIKADIPFFQCVGRGF